MLARPIIFNCVNLTEELSGLTETILKQLFTQFIYRRHNRLPQEDPEYCLPEKVMAATVDVTSLYANILHHEDIAAFDVLWPQMQPGLPLRHTSSQLWGALLLQTHPCHLLQTTENKLR